jgi:hypothetical protein
MRGSALQPSRTLAFPLCCSFGDGHAEFATDETSPELGVAGGRWSREGGVFGVSTELLGRDVLREVDPNQASFLVPTRSKLTSTEVRRTEKRKVFGISLSSNRLFAAARPGQVKICRLRSTSATRNGKRSD